MSEPKSPADEKEKSPIQGVPRGHPQQQQGHIPNQEQVGVVDRYQRQPANDTTDVFHP